MLSVGKSDALHGCKAMLRLTGSHSLACIEELCVFCGDYTRYCELMLSLLTTRRMVSANMSATESCFTFEQRLV